MPGYPTRIARLIFASLLAAVLPITAHARGDLPTVEFAFQASAPEGVRVASSGGAAFFSSVHRSGGTISAEPAAVWRVASDAPFGEGTLDFHLDRAQLSGDLALVLRADWKRDSDVAVELFDAAGHALAPDLFGNPAQNGAAAGPTRSSCRFPVTPSPRGSRFAA